MCVHVYIGWPGQKLHPRCAAGQSVSLCLELLFRSPHNTCCVPPRSLSLSHGRICILKGFSRTHSMMSLVICEMETKSEEASAGLNVAERRTQHFSKEREAALLSLFSSLSRNKKRLGDDRQDGGRSFILGLCGD